MDSPPAPLRWESASRYYPAWVQQDLFEEWALCRVWGNEDSRGGGQRSSL
ncbi:hypothetical protein [Chitinimonas lacunae]|uniref:Uncharacterized protein n=1 Tax=Chitinimonas lacunae TaxID=1963018 RepID=A0ABV8MU25_9NEIS